MLVCVSGNFLCRWFVFEYQQFFDYVKNDSFIFSFILFFLLFCFVLFFKE